MRSLDLLIRTFLTRISISYDITTIDSVGYMYCKYCQVNDFLTLADFVNDPKYNYSM